MESNTGFFNSSTGEQNSVRVEHSGYHVSLCSEDEMISSVEESAFYETTVPATSFSLNEFFSSSIQALGGNLNSPFDKKVILSGYSTETANYSFYTLPNNTHLFSDVSKKNGDDILFV